MTIAESLLKQLEPLSEFQRADLYATIASDYGAGFARVMRDELQKRLKKKSQS